MEDFLTRILGPLALVAIVLALCGLGKTLDWLDRKLEGREIKLGPWTIAKQSPSLGGTSLGGKWVLWTRTNGHDLTKIVGIFWPIFVSTVVAGLFLAYFIFNAPGLLAVNELGQG